MPIAQTVKIQLKKIFFFFCLFFSLNGCISASSLMMLENKGATLKVASDEIEIIKIDHTFVEVQQEGTSGTPYCGVVLAPGDHVVIVSRPDNRTQKGSVAYLLAAFEDNHTYLLKYEVLDRVKAENRLGLTYNTMYWNCNTWIEDAETGEKVSKVVKTL